LVLPKHLKVKAPAGAIVGRNHQTLWKIQLPQLGNDFIAINADVTLPI